ncbi:MAG: PHP domain-containing protein [Sandaracinaceae bacterium]
MTTRRAVVDALEAIAFGAELKGDRRARSWGAAAWAIRNVQGDLRAMLDSGELLKVRGVGQASARVVQQALAGEEPDALTRLREELPPGLFALRRIKGLGPKKVKALYQGLRITGLAELEYACRENRLVDLPGFGSKTQAKVLAQLESLRETAGLLRRDQAKALLEPLAAALRVHPGVERAEVVGDHARGMELVAPRLLVAGPRPEAALATRTADVRALVGTCASDRFGLVALGLTADPEHLEALAARARAQGKLAGAEDALDALEGAFPTAEHVYEALGLVPTAPERREPGVPLVEVGRAAPALVALGDLRGALHNHTVASDGSHSLAEMRDAAARRGLSYLAITEHSEAAAYARGLEPERLRAQVEAIRALNEASDGACVLLTGIESDILRDGSLDYDDATLAGLEVVVASVHRRHGQGRDEMTARMVRAAHNPRTAVIGHPTGRLLLGRAPSEVDIDALLDACLEAGCAIELNAQPQRLDLGVEHLGRARERGVPISIAADAHSVDSLGYLEHGVAVARRAGLRPEDVLNARALSELRAWLAARSQPVDMGPAI